MEKRAFEHKFTLAFISLSFIHAKWTKSKLVRALTKFGGINEIFL
jgi:hypothetical protein